MRPDATFCSSRAASAAFDTGLPLTDRITSPWRSTPADGPSGSTSVTTAPRLARRQLQPPRHLRRHVARASGRSCRCPALPAAAAALFCGVWRPPFCSASRSSSSTVTCSVFSLLVAQHLHRHRRARLGRDHHLHAARRCSATGRPLYSTMTSPGSTPAFAAGAARRHLRRRSRPRATSGRSPRSRRAARRSPCTPMRPRMTLPLRSCGSRSRTVLIGTAKPMPMFPSAARVGDDRRVDADDLAAQVQQRPARVARVDRRVGLQHVVRCGRR